MKIQVIVPAISDDYLSEGLVALTELIATRAGDDLVSHGFLGGEYGYGAHWNSDVFQMHPYCWCERPDCAWCAGCWCLSNIESGWGRCLPEGTEPPYKAGEQCDWCNGTHRWADKGALPPREPPHYGAPHFWHKPSGFRIWWYKYIGRDMQTYGTARNLQAMFDACRNDVICNTPSPPPRPATAGEA